MKTKKIKCLTATLFLFFMVVLSCSKAGNQLIENEELQTNVQVDSAEIKDILSEKKLTNEEVEAELLKYYEKKANIVFNLYIQSQRSFMLGNYSQAMEYINASLDELPYEQGYLFKSLIHIRKNELELAEENFEMAKNISLDPQKSGINIPFRDFLIALNN